MQPGYPERLGDQTDRLPSVDQPEQDLLLYGVMEIQNDY